MFLWHFPWGCPPWPLASTLPCGARTFLPPCCHGRRPFDLLRRVVDGVETSHDRRKARTVQTDGDGRERQRRLQSRQRQRLGCGVRAPERAGVGDVRRRERSTPLEQRLERVRRERAEAAAGRE